MLNFKSMSYFHPQQIREKCKYHQMIMHNWHSKICTTYLFLNQLCGPYSWFIFITDLCNVNIKIKTFVMDDVLQFDIIFLLIFSHRLEKRQRQLYVYINKKMKQVMYLETIYLFQWFLAQLEPISFISSSIFFDAEYSF